MKITAIRRHEQLKGRYSIYVDGVYAFSLSTDALLETKVVIGQEIGETELKTFRRLSDDDKAYGIALAYVARRMRSRWELIGYLKRKGYNDQLTDKIMMKLEKRRLVDDDTFAEAWVRNRRLLKSVSTHQLKQELLQKRVAEETIERVLADDETDELSVLHELINRRRRQTKYQDNLKLMRYLVRQGFSYEDIKLALAEED